MICFFFFFFFFFFFCATLKMKVSVLHARLRNSCSSLNQDLYDNHLRHDPICICLRGTETAEHYFFKCEHFMEQRIHSFKKKKRVNFILLMLTCFLKEKIRSQILITSGFFNLFKIIYMPRVDLLTSPNYSRKSLYDYMYHIQLCFNIFRLFFRCAIKRSCCK